MKKLKIIFLGLILVLIGLLAACQPPGNSSSLFLATGGTSGTYYPLGGSMATIANKYSDHLNISVQATGASVENIRLLTKGEVDFIIVQNDVLHYAANGIEMFQGEKLQGMTGVCTLYPEVIQVVAEGNSSINSIKDLEGKRVSIGDAGSGVEANALQVLAAYGLTKDNVKISRLSFKESGEALKNQQIDAFFVTSGIPNTAIIELGITRAVKIIPISGKEAAKLREEYPFYSAITIPKEVYKTSEDVETIAVRAMIAAREDLPEQVVYSFVQSVFSHLPELAQSHAKGKEIRLEDAPLGMTIKLHPGAERYFREFGAVQ